MAAGKIGREIVDGMGADRLARTILEEVPPRVSVRRAAPGDCRDIWRWRNSSQVRRISFDRAAIPYENHKEWFEKKLKDEFTEIYIGENDEKKIGQARFDLDVEEPTAHINVNLNPAFFNKGFGNRLIKFATEEFLRKNPQRTVIAEVLDDNIVSKKAFSKAGYQFCYNTVKGGRDISIFKFNAKETRVSK